MSVKNTLKRCRKAFWANFAQNAFSVISESFLYSTFWINTQHRLATQQVIAGAEAYPVRRPALCVPNCQTQGISLYENCLTPLPHEWCALKNRPVASETIDCKVYTESTLRQLVQTKLITHVIFEHIRICLLTGVASCLQKVAHYEEIADATIVNVSCNKCKGISTKPGTRMEKR